MKKSVFKTLWAAVCVVVVSTMGVLSVFASEQIQGRGVSMMITMDVIQTVSLIIVIAIAILVFAFYLAKMVLKKMYIAPEESDKGGTRNEEDR